MNERFGTSRTQESIEAKARRMDLTRPNARREWTKEEDKLLTDAYQQHQTRSIRMAALQNMSALDRTESSIEKRAYILGLGRNGNKKQFAPVLGSKAQATNLGKTEQQPWTEEEDSLLTNVHRQYEDWADRVSEFNKQSVRSRTQRAIGKRTCVLGLESKAPKAWTADEYEFMRTAMKEFNDWGILLGEFHGKFGSARSLPAISGEPGERSCRCQRSYYLGRRGNQLPKGSLVINKPESDRSGICKEVPKWTQYSKYCAQTGQTNGTTWGQGNFASKKY